jgi:hypothetical protein
MKVEEPETKSQRLQSDRRQRWQEEREARGEKDPWPNAAQTSLCGAKGVQPVNNKYQMRCKLLSQMNRQLWCRF